jgi:outer membrane protein TolC
MEGVMKRALLVFVIAILVLSSGGQAQAVKEDQTLTLDECLEISLKRHPDIRGAQAVIKALQSRADQVDLEWKPDLGFSGSYNRRSITDKGFDRYSNSLTMSKLLSDGGKTELESTIAKLQLKISEYDYDTVLQNLLYDVKEAYFNLLKAQKRVQVAEEAVRMYEHRLRQAEAFYEVGRVPRYDVTTAEVDLSRGKLELVQARTGARSARSSLNNAMGFPEAPEFSIEDMLSYEEVGFSQDRAVATAMEMRPQLNARRTEKTSAEKSVNLASRSNNPVLKANAGYSWGDEDYTGNEELYLGVSVNVPIYDKGLAREKTREARFRVEEADAKLTALEQDVILEVEKAYMEVHDSIEAIDTAAKTVQQAMQNLELANGRYEVGVGSPVEVTDATENYISATNSYYTTLYDYWLALAALEKATGGIIE